MEACPSSPIVFYRSVKTFRNFPVAIMLVINLLMVINFGNGLTQTVIYHNKEGPPEWFFWIGTGLFGLAVLTILLKMIKNDPSITEITDRGVRVRGNLHPWPNIIRIGK